MESRSDTLPLPRVICRDDQPAHGAPALRMCLLNLLVQTNLRIFIHHNGNKNKQKTQKENSEKNEKKS